MKTLIGNAVVGQSGGPTAAINATLSGVIRGVLAARETIPTLYGMRNGVEGLLGERFVDLTEIFSDEKDLLTGLLLRFFFDEYSKARMCLLLSRPVHHIIGIMLCSCRKEGMG